MTEANEPTEVERWHKRFGVQCNNRGWELSFRAREHSQAYARAKAALAAIADDEDRDVIAKTFARVPAP